MHKLKKAAAVAVMVGGIGLVGGGVASANVGHGSDGPFPHGVTDNLQVQDCEQSFDGGTAVTPSSILGPVTGDQEVEIGNSCQQASVEDD
ncbi:hypothetical protein [Streptomyces sp. NBC_00019]|uniref:hypothetical protein n=1 Tax=Streptomyces sp. NBC_00019 TaxID=2975623 RepID=UPI00324B9421